MSQSQPHDGHGGHGSHGGHHMMATTPPTADHSVDHAEHNMGQSGSHVMTHTMMKMYFHFDLGDTILFRDAVIDTVWSTILACFLFFLLAFLYEGLKCYREYLIKKNMTPSRYAVAVVGETANGAAGDRDPSLGSGRWASSSRKMLSLPHVIQSLMHMIQVAVSYTLMLGFMTFNGWLCISILLGAGFGYFVFCWRKLKVVDVTEHCH